METQGAESRPRIRSTTVLCVRRGGTVVMAADGQVTMGDSVIKHSAQEDPPPLPGQDSRRIRRFHRRRVLALRPLRSEAGTIRRQSGPLGSRAGQGLAHRQDAALAGSAAGRRRSQARPSSSADQATSSSPMRASPPSAAGGSLRTGRGPCADGEHRALRARDRGEVAAIAGQICIYTNDQITIEELTESAS